jgi:protein gp37
MATITKIEWTDHTCNLWHGCAKVHAGCDHCYANALSKRYGHDLWGLDRPRKLIKSAFADLTKFQKDAAASNTIRRVFVGSMMDIFEKPMPLIDSSGNLLDITSDALRQQLFQNISNNLYPNLMFLLLTKRPSNINKYIPDDWKQKPPVNVMFGTSPVDQSTAYNLINHLVQVNGKRFLSVEPQLDLISIMPWLKAKLIDWVIVGGESGPGRRPFNTDWGRVLRDECLHTNTPFFFKQVDKVLPIPADLMIRQFYH